MDKLDPKTDGASQDIVADNIDKLRELFPDAFTEGSDADGPRWKVDFDALKACLGEYVEDERERYSFTWNGKDRARRIAQTPSAGTLRPCPEESVNWNTTQNLFIEGDNLEVLKLLQKSYHKQVKMIYIDPPYNTGGEFIYPDRFQDNLDTYLRYTGQMDGEGFKTSANSESAGRYHTNWLNMMYPRLRLARNLLKDEGVIVSSIDDHELPNLRHLFDEIFGSENFVACMVWEKGRKNDAKLVSVGHEYVLIYAKSLAHLRELDTRWREEKPGAKEIWREYERLRGKHGDDDRSIEADLHAWYAALPKSHPSKKWSRYKRVDQHGPWRDRDISWPGGGGPRYDVRHPITGQPCKVPERGWIYATAEEMQRQIRLGLVEFRDDHSEPPFRKAHIRPIKEEFEPDKNDDSVDTGNGKLAAQVRGSYFYKQSQVTVKALRDLMGAKVFDNPKDHDEVARLIDYVTSGDPESIVMDFFAGSGTTGQSVLQLNAQDDGTRRYILVQLPEQLDIENKEQRAAALFCDKIGKPHNISELTKERLRRATKRIKDAHSEWTGDQGFRVFKLTQSNFNAWAPDPANLQRSLLDHQQSMSKDRSSLDILYEVLLKLGLTLTASVEKRDIGGKTVHIIGAGALIVCLADAVDLDLVNGIAALKAELAPEVMRVVFKDNGFTDDVVKTNAVQILRQAGVEDVKSL